MARYQIDPDHTVAHFQVMNMDVAWVHGQFNTVSGFIEFDPGDLSKTRAEIAIGAAGIYTGVEKRNEHLRSADFLDVAQFPTITFASTEAHPYGANRFRLTGDLTMRGVTRPVVLEVDYLGTVKAPQGETTAGFTASTVLHRLDWGVAWNRPMGLGRLLVGNEVKVSIEMEADLEQ
jgi:polyisoprenoid-binding protein YceI